METQQPFELYLHDKQKNGELIKGFDLEKHFGEPHLIHRRLSLEDALVRGWLEDPSTYPVELRNKTVSLWKSRVTVDGQPCVACLTWNGKKVIVFCYNLGHDWTFNRPALLTASSEAVGVLT